MHGNKREKCTDAELLGMALRVIQALRRSPEVLHEGLVGPMDRARRSPLDNDGC
jgi:hypothetical protein